MAKKATSNKAPALAGAGIEIVYRVDGQEFTDREKAEAHASKHSVEARTASAVSAVMQRTAARKRNDVHTGVKHMCQLMLTNPELLARVIEICGSEGTADPKAAAKAVAKSRAPRTPKSEDGVKAPRKPRAPKGEIPTENSESPKPAKVPRKPRSPRVVKGDGVVEAFPPSPSFAGLPPPPPLPR
jgi:hypothetical protein